MAYTTDRSQELFKRAVQVMIEGGSSPSRGPINYGEYPLFIEKGHGAHIYDVDGNKYIDWMMAYGALPLGHAHPSVVNAVADAVKEGTLFAAATEIEIEVAEMIQKMIPSAERVRFANTGTEAAMAAIRLARGYTGKKKFIKFEGHYHGWYDDFLVNAHPHHHVSLGHRNDPVKIAESSGLSRFALQDTVIVPWNDLEALERAVETYSGQVAAVITEGIMANMGVIPPEPGYLKGLRDLTEKNHILLILDETVTGFRISPGGCQEYYGIKPDISVFGKALGTGFPVAAFVGREDIMQALAWGGVLHYGTQNASRIGLYAARASIGELTRKQGAMFKKIWSIGDALCSGLRELIKKYGVDAVVQNVGPMFQIMFTDKKSIRDYREFCEFVDKDKYQMLAQKLFQHGIYMSPSAALHSIVSTAHQEEDVSFTLDAVEKVLKEMK